MERIRVYAVGDALYAHPGGHRKGVECRFIGRKHVRVPVVHQPDPQLFPHADTHKAEFPIVPEGEVVLVGDVSQGAEMQPSDLMRAIAHGDLSLSPPANAPTLTITESAAEAPHVES
jgi:hypothetical protein